MTVDTKTNAPLDITAESPSVSDVSLSKAAIVPGPKEKELPAKKNAFLLTVAGFLIVYFAVCAGQQSGGKQLFLFLVGCLMGVVLYYAQFGFTSSWRVFIKERKGRGLRAQMLMLGLAVCLFFPALGNGELFGNPVRGNVSALGISTVVGAFIFGIGMQLGGGCASGTLFTVGGGNVKMMITLFFFCFSSLLASSHLWWWADLPSFEPISLVTEWGAVGAVFFSLGLFAIITAVTIFVEKKKFGELEEVTGFKKLPVELGWKRYFKGPLTLFWASIALTLLNYITLALAGRPWGVTSAFAVWMAKVAAFTGLEVHTWTYWSGPANALALEQNLFMDVTSMQNFGIMLGAWVCSLLQGKFAPSQKMPAGAVWAAVVGGLLLGYGARLAFGCNIGAYFSGIASGSVHAWAWLFLAFSGNAVGVYIRPFFFPGEAKPKAVLTAC